MSSIGFSKTGWELIDVSLRLICQSVDRPTLGDNAHLPISPQVALSFPSRRKLHGYATGPLSSLRTNLFVAQGVCGAANPARDMAFALVERAFGPKLLVAG